MNSPAILQRHPGLRWLVPFGIACVAGLAATGLFRANASSESLPRTTPAALMAAVQDNHVDGFSGTVVSHLSLGLPELPSVATLDENTTSFTALLSGSHTMQIWYGGADKQRVALLGPTDEADLFRSGRDVWQWSSAEHTAVHSVLPTGRSATDDWPMVAGSLTPGALARRALKVMDPSTRVAVDTDHTVADRSAYELVLTPRSSTTKIGSVHISVDGATKVPLGVQVYPRGSSSAAIDVAFTSIRFAAQPERNFAFAPPPAARVKEMPQTQHAQHTLAAQSASISGSGWNTVVQLATEADAAATYNKSALLKQLTPVSGSWGKGRLLDSPLLSVLVIKDGRVYAGAVDPGELYAAAGSK